MFIFMFISTMHIAAVAMFYVARSLFHCDEDIIHWALNYDMQIVDFEKLCSLIVMSLQKKRKILKK